VQQIFGAAAQVIDVEGLVQGADDARPQWNIFLVARSFLENAANRLQLDRSHNLSEISFRL
jgi:hypothetical protein